MKKILGSGIGIFRGNTKNFSEAEFYCKCGNCSLSSYNMQKALVDRLQYARTLADMPFIIRRGCLCGFNMGNNCGDGLHSHINGLAVDLCADPSSLLSQYGLHMTDSLVMGKMINALLQAKFKHIGVHFDRRFIHVDIAGWTKHSAVRIWGGA